MQTANKYSKSGGPPITKHLQTKLDAICNTYGDELKSVIPLYNASGVNNVRPPTGFVWVFDHRAKMRGDPFPPNMHAGVSIVQINGTVDNRGHLDAGFFAHDQQYLRAMDEFVETRMRNVGDKRPTPRPTNLDAREYTDCEEWVPLLERDCGEFLGIYKGCLSTTDNSVNGLYFIVVRSGSGPIGRSLYAEMDEAAISGEMTIAQFFRSPLTDYNERVARRNRLRLIYDFAQAAGLSIKTQTDTDACEEATGSQMANPLVDVVCNQVTITHNEVVFYSECVNGKNQVFGVPLCVSPHHGVVVMLCAPHDTSRSEIITPYGPIYINKMGITNRTYNAIPTSSGRIAAIPPSLVPGAGHTMSRMNAHDTSVVRVGCSKDPAPHDLSAVYNAPNAHMLAALDFGWDMTWGQLLLDTPVHVLIGPGN